MDMFKAGDRVRFTGKRKNDPFGMAAQTGATGTVGKRGVYPYGRETYVDIIWDNNKLKGTQRDGGYYVDVFEKIEAVNPVGGFIVIRVDSDGLYEPARTPRIHENLESAQTEAKRLASVTLGYTFRVLRMENAYKASMDVREVA